MAGGRKLVDEWRPWPLLTRDQIEQSPSFQKGMTFKTEKKLRETSCKIIGEAGKTLEQGIVSIATAQVYFVRYFAFKDYQHNDHFIVAVAALFVASKTENKPRGLGHIAHACWRHWVEIWIKDQKRKDKTKPQAYWQQLQAAETSMIKDPEFFKRYTEAITRAERVLLYTTGFQFNVNTGFEALLGSTNLLVQHSDPVVRQFFSTLELQSVWNIVIELYKSTRICLERDPRTIGIACYELTCTHLKREIPLVDGDSWWKYVARLCNWPADCGEPKAVKAIQDELMKLFFKDKSSSGAEAQPPRTDAPGSQPGTPLMEGSRTPAASPLPPLPVTSVASTSGKLEAEAVNGTHPAGEGSLPRLPSGPPPVSPPPELAGGELTDAHNGLQHASTAEVKQKEEGQAVHFSPSDEFNVSPPRSESARDTDTRAKPDALASLESGELAPSVAADPPQDPAMMRIRLERAKNLMKLKLGSSGDASAPKPAENSLEDELDVHFEP